MDREPKSLDLKMKAVIDGGAAGMAFWKLGMETAAVWDTVANIVDKSYL